LISSRNTRRSLPLVRGAISTLLRSIFAAI
jgi:hypothetical protein